VFSENLKQYDKDFPVTYEAPAASPGLDIVNAYLVENFIKPAQAANAKTGWENKRQRFEDAGLARDLEAEFPEATAEHKGKHVPGAWTLIKGADPKKRILYLHGGAFTVGSAISHRPITYNLAKQTGAIVYTPNYRLMPENPRTASIEDSQTAYKWILENGPDGKAPLESFGMAGDSAGGNLTLMMTQWARDAGLRPVDAAIAFSPATDSTASSPSIKSNLETDLMLQPLVRPLVKLPRWLLLMGMRKNYGMKPSDPRISPIHGDLSKLPPTLIQASKHEILYNDATRFTAKAQGAGSPVTLQSWTHMPHVFQIFDDALPEAHEAFKEVGAFLKAQGF